MRGLDLLHPREVGGPHGERNPLQVREVPGKDRGLEPFPSSTRDDLPSILAVRGSGRGRKIDGIGEYCFDDLRAEVCLLFSGIKNPPRAARSQLRV
jgi:hypothetical protein